MIGFEAAYIYYLIQVYKNMYIFTRIYIYIGFVHDMILGFEAVLSDGRVLWCTREENSDLFYALPGSFGSLAICTRVKILCVKAEPYVQVRTHYQSKDKL